MYVQIKAVQYYIASRLFYHINTGDYQSMIVISLYIFEYSLNENLFNNEKSIKKQGNKTHQQRNKTQGHEYSQSFLGHNRLTHTYSIQNIYWCRSVVINLKMTKVHTYIFTDISLVRLQTWAVTPDNVTQLLTFILEEKLQRNETADQNNAP